MSLIISIERNFYLLHQIQNDAISHADYNEKWISKLCSTLIFTAHQFEHDTISFFFLFLLIIYKILFPLLVVLLANRRCCCHFFFSTSFSLLIFYYSLTNLHFRCTYICGLVYVYFFSILIQLFYTLYLHMYQNI